MLREVRFRYVQKECCWQETTRRHPQATLLVTYLYPLSGDMVVEARLNAGDEATRKAIEAEWKADPRMHDVSTLETAGATGRYVVHYSNRTSVYQFITRASPIRIGGIWVIGGCEHHTILGEASGIDALLADLRSRGEVEVEAVSPARPQAGPDEPFTDRQLEVFVLAHALGYYEHPRRASAQDVAEHLGLSYSAVREQLRRTELQLVAQAVRRMRAGDPGRWDAALQRVRSAVART